MRTKLALLNIEMLIFATLIHKPWCAITRRIISSILNYIMIYDLPIETLPHTIPQFIFIIVELIYNCTFRTTLAIIKSPSSHHLCGLNSSHMEIPSHLLQFQVFDYDGNSVHIVICVHDIFGVWQLKDWPSVHEHVNHFIDVFIEHFRKFSVIIFGKDKFQNSSL